MAYVYILFSKKLNNYYTGSCLDLKDRLTKHHFKAFSNSYTAKADDWVLFFCIDNLSYKQARGIEMHIKKMKSKSFIKNLHKYPELSQKLISKYK